MVFAGHDPDGRLRRRIRGITPRRSAGSPAVALAIAAITSATGAGCFPDLEGLAGGVRDDGGARVEGGAPGSGDTLDASAPCPGLAGPVAVPVATPAGTFCIDATEVTNDHYALFLAAKTAATDQPATCAWNTSFVPAAWPPSSGALPVVGVDWCDAAAFCAWAGKRLCGRIGGGPSAPAAENDARASQWFSACSRGGERAYPYGNAFDPEACNGAGRSSGPAPAGAQPSCSGGYDGVLDLSGNVEEWVDACDGAAGANDACLSRGGNYSMPRDELGCRTVSDLNAPDSRLEPRSRTEPWRGFRCCS